MEDIERIENRISDAKDEIRLKDKEIQDHKQHSFKKPNNHALKYVNYYK